MQHYSPTTIIVTAKPIAVPLHSPPYHSASNTTIYHHAAPPPHHLPKSHAIHSETDEAVFSLFPASFPLPRKNSP
ncbi:hypothetical protein E2C01_060244 [Portunus trituberculatus]|uniref:Uncharacterized protein n=1 Tax=Portunus trituberculatus TaxID=210409 RepID=A0A5B7H0G0_PORTR|nr:hypothetical protein [Portunus trituberculatus]